MRVRALVLPFLVGACGGAMYEHAEAARQVATCETRLTQAVLSQATCEDAQAQANDLVKNDADCRAAYPRGIDVCKLYRERAAKRAALKDAGADVDRD